MQQAHDMADSASSLGWLCANRTLLVNAKAVLDQYTDTSEQHGVDSMFSGTIGPVKVTLTGPLQPLHLVDALAGVKSILLTCVSKSPVGHGVEPGDLVILLPRATAGDGQYPVSTRGWGLLQQAEMLQREVGADGYWLSDNFSAAVSSPSDPVTQPDGDTVRHPQLHYANTGQDDGQHSLSEKVWEKMITTKNPPGLEAITGALKSISADIVLVLAASKFTKSSDDSDQYAAANVASYAKELIRGAMEDKLANSIPSLRGTEGIVAPRVNLTLPPFEVHQFTRYGNAVLLVIPTANKSKARLLRDTFAKQRPKDVVMHSITVPVESGVGEQPYNEAGAFGAHNRISNALRRIRAPDNQDKLASKGIGTVMVASIENYIQFDNVDRPVDFGLVVIHNATAGKTVAGLSSGASVPPAYVERARRFGFEGNPNYGRVTVGQIMAAHVPGLDKADWQGVLTGCSRYDLLSEAIDRLTIPW
ncbi:hypothetical protein MRS44_018299 [Fusarium solani]|uniref:uncharacterized protein n=1 Tax=Fusarium solani TaxID=169388 RepID=UPI0032C48A93|nr:hypothetical protein MRS44_018299 [Fusarium solani]